MAIGHNIIAIDSAPARHPTRLRSPVAAAAAAGAWPTGARGGGEIIMHAAARRLRPWRRDPSWRRGLDAAAAAASSSSSSSSSSSTAAAPSGSGGPAPESAPRREVGVGVPSWRRRLDAAAAATSSTAAAFGRSPGGAVPVHVPMATHARRPPSSSAGSVGSAPESTPRPERTEARPRAGGNEEWMPARKDRRSDISSPESTPRPERTAARPRAGGAIHPRETREEAARRALRAEFDGCGTVGALLAVAARERGGGRRASSDDGSVASRLSPRTIVAFWKAMASLVTKGGSYASLDGWRAESGARRARDGRSARKELRESLRRTADEMGRYEPWILAEVAQAVAVVAKFAAGDGRGGEGRRDSNEEVARDALRDAFAGGAGRDFWTILRDVAAARADEFRPRWLVSVAWAFATTAAEGGERGRRRADVDLRPFFSSVRETFDRRRGDFSYKAMGNLAWARATCGGPPDDDDGGGLLDELAGEFARRRGGGREGGSGGGATKRSARRNARDATAARDDDLPTPATLAQWATAYSKPDRRDDEARNRRTLFASIADASLLVLDDFDARALSNLVHACAAVDIDPRSSDGRRLSAAVADAAVRKGNTFPPPNVASAMWALAKLGNCRTESFEAFARACVLDRPREGLRRFSPRQLATIAWASSKFAADGSSSEEEGRPSSDVDEVFDRIAEEVLLRRDLDRFDSRGVATLAKSFAAAGRRDPPAFWDEVERVATDRSPSLVPAESGRIAWSFATIGRRADGFFEGLLRSKVAAATSAGEAEPEGLSHLAWSLATLDYDFPEFFEEVAREVVRRTGDFGPRDRVMLALAYARRGDSGKSGHPEVFDAIATEPAVELSRYSGLDLFNLVTNGRLLARPQPTVKKLLFTKQSSEQPGRREEFKPLPNEETNLREEWARSVADEIARRRSEFSPEMLVGMAWAYASAGHRIPELFDVAADGCIGRCHELRPTEVASLAWSLATVDHVHRPFLAALADAPRKRWRDFDAPSLANVAWAYAALREDRPVLFDEIADAAVERHRTHRAEFAMQGVSMLLFACAAVGRTDRRADRRLFDAMEPTIAAGMLGECDGQPLANVAWAYAVADVDADSLFGADVLFGGQSPFADAVGEKINDFNHQGLCQLHQWNLWRKEKTGKSALPPLVAKLCHDAFARTSIHKSALQRDVASQLAKMGLLLEEEALTPSGYRLDSLVEINGNKIGIEVDGPYHFVGRSVEVNWNNMLVDARSGPTGVEVDGPAHFVGQRPHGKTVLKRRQVAKVDGIPVVSLPYWEWNDLDSDDEKQRYIRSKIDGC